MLFMGEQWGATSPFPFFCDFHGDLAEAVRQGRRREFAGAYAKYGDEIPDPLELSTVQSAVLDWKASDAEPGRARLKLVRDLLAVRAREIVPRLAGPRLAGQRLAGARFGEARAADNGLLTAHWRMGDGATLSLIANLSNQKVSHSPDKIEGTVIWGSALNRNIPPWSVFWRIG